MAIIKCKMCGGDLEIKSGSTVCECEYCGSMQTVPNQDDEKKLVLFERANRLRYQCEFDKAAGLYESIVADFRTEAEAYWGLVLCKYGIEYVDDPATGKKVPTCHRSSFDSVMDDPNFEQALENADAVARKVYRDEAKAIEELRKGIIEVSGREEPYDIFICYKETAENGERTVDSVIAQDVYDALTEKGYRVFFSRITLEDKLGQEYEPYIFAALNSAKIMLAFGTDYEYYNAVWVKNEWSRFLQLMAKDKSKHLIPCYKGIDAYDMPKEFAHLQAQDMGKVGALQDLLRGVEKLIPRQKTMAAPSITTTTTPEQDRFLKRAMVHLESGENKEALSYFNRHLENFPEDYRAWWGMVRAKTHDFFELQEGQNDVVSDYHKAVRFAPEDQKEAIKKQFSSLVERSIQNYKTVVEKNTGTLEAREKGKAGASEALEGSTAEKKQLVAEKEQLEARLKKVDGARIPKVLIVLSVIATLYLGMGIEETMKGNMDSAGVVVTMVGPAVIYLITILCAVRVARRRRETRSIRKKLPKLNERIGGLENAEHEQRSKVNSAVGSVNAAAAELQSAQKKLTWYQSIKL